MSPLARTHGQLVTADDFAEQQEAGEQRQAAAARKHQRHPRTAARRFAPTPVGDQQERGKAGQFPEHQQLDQVLRQDHAEHRAHEQQQIGIEPAQTVFQRQVIVGVENHQQADAEDQQGEQQAKAIEAEGQIKAGGGYPGQALDRGDTAKARGHCRQ
jgi:hypothetical protein